ncbi:MAG TPA: YIP1 family protein [Luteimonas sp.]|nr:YIP1 family protein [Luteimonas sp.]
MAHLVDIYLQPGKVFSDLREKPTFLLPMALLIIASAVMPLWYFLTVDPDWYLQHMMLASGRDMTPEQIQQASAVLPGARLMGWIGAGSAAVMIAVVYCLYALYLMLAGKVTGGSVSFKKGLSLISWSSMPGLLAVVVALVGIATMKPQTSLESLMLTNVDPLLVQLPPDSPWRALAQGFSLLNFWSWFLLALGWRVFNRAGWLQSAIVALLPSVVIYGGMALFALAK